MGFKCRALVLQGQLDASEHDCERLRAQVEQQQQQHKELSVRKGRIVLKSSAMQVLKDYFQSHISMCW